ncbi:MAG TPA: SDR family NAD(P)-dependent oxidoreductase [Candidatus Acidoferrales bacterium]|nr:SDR family NAD(P)-dependent oxidoreductase [Candidatus Acidoferrales bacterium]
MNALCLPKIAVIAGVGSGLGAALARRFVLGGWRVVLFARSSEYIEALASELNAKSKSDVARAIRCDLTDPKQISVAFAKIRKEIGLVDVLVNNASGGGGPRGSSLMNLDPASFEQAWRVGVYGALLCSREAARDMLSPERDGANGAIIFTGATSSVRGAGIAFSSAKFASRGLAQGIARELWPQGIHVARVIIYGIIGEADGKGPMEDSNHEPELYPDAIVEAYWQLVLQDRSAWTLELDLRPNREKFFE